MLQVNEAGAGTHVLLIGVGNYSAGNIPPLASVAPSVEAMAEWWNRGFVNSTAPLRSLDVISSNSTLETSAGGTDFQALSNAIRTWHERVSADPENIAVFYFVGHGLQTTEGYALLAGDLVLESPGSSAAPPTDQAIAVDELVGAFRAGPSRQLWMFDTARDWASSSATRIRARSPLIAQAPSSAPMRRLILYAAREGGLAFAPTDGPTDFARAFLETVQAHPDSLNTAQLANEMTARVQEIRGEQANAGIETQSTDQFELIMAESANADQPTIALPDEAVGSVLDPDATVSSSSTTAETQTDGASTPRDPTGLAQNPAELGTAAPPPDLEFLDDDAQLEVDNLGRGSLAVVVARRLHAIWRKSNPKRLSPRDEDRSGFVMHLDAPWGGGKTTFSNFVARVLNPYGYGSEPAQFLREHYGAEAGLGAVFAADPPRPREQPSVLAEEFRRPWIVIEYNAWRMEHTSPPWWTFYQVIRKGCFGSILREGDGAVDLKTGLPVKVSRWCKACRWGWLWANELRWRIWTPKLIVPLAAFLLSVLIFVCLWKLGWVGASSPGPGKQETFGFLNSTIAGWIMTGLAGLTVVGGIASLIVESLVPGVDPLAERVGLGRSDPLARFRRHFHRTMCRLRRPVLVIIDDLDRCKPAVIVDLVRGIHTILRSPRVVFLVLGDRNWLECAFETVHADMAKVVGGVEQTVGARFVEKAIQLSFLLPGLDPKQQKDFVAGLLHAGSTAAGQGAQQTPSVDLRTAARAAAKAEPGAAFDAEQLRSSVLDTPVGQEFVTRAAEELQRTQPSDNLDELHAEARRRAGQIVNEEIAIQAAVASSVETETAKRLAPLAPWLPSNPRQIKRILNGIALYHAAALQHPTFSTVERWFQLALWVVLMTEWPMTWRLLSACPELAGILCEDDPVAGLARADKMLLPGTVPATQREIQRIISSPELMALIAGRGGRQGDRLDTAAVRELLTLTPPNAKLPRLQDEAVNTDPKSK